MAGQTQKAEGDAHGIRILLVEDERDLRQSFADYLTMRGNTVTEASSGLEFYRALRKQKFDVAIIDVNLTDISGFELAEELAKETEGVGIVMLTARAGREDRISGYSAGADLYLTKPVDGDELLLAVNNLARRLSEKTSVALAPWKLDTVGYTLTAPNGTRIELTGRELDFLKLLADGGGNPVSRAVLSAELGYDDRPEARGIDAIIQRLKHKAGAIDMDLPIKTIRLVGTSFTATVEVR
ncbi:MAG: response regulator transcription factor [Martelella sp.]|uniref:response regulator transcription factor n=1 Tax=Martelella sp. TaxID=1969699 RepID=UPI003242E076